MKRKDSAIILVLSLAAFGASLWAQRNSTIIQELGDMYFGHVSLADVKNDGKDVLVFRAWSESPEIAVLNLPLGPGDTIRTSSERRLEVQFDNATIMRLDTNTELKIEAILAERRSASGQKVTSFVLVKGRVYVMYQEYDGKEIFQVLTPNAAVKFKHATVASVAVKDYGTTDVQVEYGKCYVLCGPDGYDLTEQTVAKGKSATVYKSNWMELGPLMMNGAFDVWNRSMNEDSEDLHRGRGPVPNTIRRLPKAVYYFAQTFGGLYGEWRYDDYFGYVWRPFFNDSYPSETWQPYFYGHWTSFAGLMFWVPDEPWGWVPYHLGIWQWDENKGWFWIPGSAFAPAWVDWITFSDESDYAWLPWSMWDWYWLSDFGWNDLDDLSYAPFYGWRYYNQIALGDLSQRDDGNGKRVLTKVTKDQLKRPIQAPYTIPKEFGGVLKALDKGLRQKDSRLIASLRTFGKHAVVLSKSSLSSSFSAVGTLERIVRGSSGGPSSSAGRSPIFLAGSHELSAALNRIIAPPLHRVLDWNPDVRLRYSSRPSQSSVTGDSFSNPTRPLNRFDIGNPGGDRSGGSMSVSSGGMNGGSSASANSGSGSSSSSSSSGASSNEKGGGHIR